MPQLAVLRQMRVAKDAIDRDWSQSLDVDALAAQAGYSRFHFVRTFRTVYGETPGQYLTGRRIERAQEMLRSVNLTVTEICTLVGFSSLGSFSVKFKQIVGMSPTEYRRRNVDNGSTLIPGCFALLFVGAGFRNSQEASPPPSS